MRPAAAAASRRITEADLVPLRPDHPGFRDPVYRARREALCQVALAYEEGTPVPEVDYTPDEHAVWREVWRELEPLHARYACREYVAAEWALGLDRARLPQLEAVNARLARRGGFRLRPAPGLVADRLFLESLARGVFLSTQYVRHPSTPLYTPEPDVVHELIGHAVALSDPAFAGLSRSFGAAAARAGERTLARLARVYWYTVEFGVVREGRALKVCGASLLSSYGELGGFESRARLLPWDLERMADRPYTVTDYQDALFVAPSLGRLVEDVERWLAAQAG